MIIPRPISKHITRIIFTSLALFPVFNLKAQAICWKVSGNSLDKNSYLFGTMHIVPAKDFSISPYIKQLFNSCQTLALEVDINLRKSDKEKLGTSVLLPNGKVMADYCTAEELSLINRYMYDSLKIGRIKARLYQRIKPVYLSGIWLHDLIKKPRYYEQEFSKIARRRGMHQVGLERIEFQMDLMDTISIADQIDELVISIKEGTAVLSGYHELLKVYLSRDVEKLYTLTTAMEGSMKNFEDVFISNRNQSWIPSIESLMREQPTFIAVGAAHLGGPQGLIALLRKKGYLVEPIE